MTTWIVTKMHLSTGRMFLQDDEVIGAVECFPHPSPIFSSRLNCVQVWFHFHSHSYRTRSPACHRDFNSTLGGGQIHNPTTKPTPRFQLTRRQRSLPWQIQVVIYINHIILLLQWTISSLYLSTSICCTSSSIILAHYSITNDSIFCFF